MLDLGPPLASNIKLLSGLGCRVRIADLHRSLSAESIESRQPEAMGALLERLLPMAPDERFDALLAWDVLDYLRPDQVSSLMARLTPACRPGALALVMVSTRRDDPRPPGSATGSWTGTPWTATARSSRRGPARCTRSSTSRT